MEMVIICLTAFIAALLTFFSGFGLGTILTPVFLIFFPVDLAIALTGLVHFFNNIFKLILTGRNADKNVLLRFGLPAVIAAALGAWLLLQISNAEPLFTYHAFGRQLEVYPVNLILAILLICFALLDLIPFLNKFHFGQKHMVPGGLLSGFFGGLSGHQGALRSAFLIRSGLSKEVFIGTTVVISSFVDFSRLIVYASRFYHQDLSEHIPLIIAATLSAITGAFIGLKLLKKVTLKFIQVMVVVMLILISIALGAGLI